MNRAWNWIIPLFVLLAVGGLWLSNMLLYRSACLSLAERGQFGDQFGAVNALFSGLAFAGIIYTLMLQQKDLKMQRDAMEMQRQEMAKSREEFEQQNFQNKFFALMKHQLDLLTRASAAVSRLDYTQYSNQEVPKVDVFEATSAFQILAKEVVAVVTALNYRVFPVWNGGIFPSPDFDVEYRQHLDANERGNYIYEIQAIGHTNLIYGITEEQWLHSKTMSPVQIGRLAYAFVFTVHNRTLGTYFRHLYNVLKFLKDTKSSWIAPYQGKSDEESLRAISAIKDEFDSYAKFIQANLSPDELFLTFFNALNFDKSLVLMKEFPILDNLSEESMLGIKSGDVAGITFKRGRRVIERAMDPAKHFEE
jgi:hypothetical protein